MKSRKNNMSNLKVQALKAKYEAQKLEALATLEVYIKNAAGIGEHPQVIDEMDKLVRAIADADGCIEILNRVFVASDSGTEVGEGGVGTVNG
jgi:hypothetical protein